MGRLSRGDLLPDRSPVGASRSGELLSRLEANEAPGVNTCVDGEVPLIWEEALGANVLDVDGRVYLDLTSGFGVAAIGHRHPEVVAAVVEQSGRLLHGLGDVAAHPGRIALAARLVELAPVDDPQVYFAVSGSDAIEIALKTALLATGRDRVLAFAGGYHGLTLGALATTSRPAFRDPFSTRLTPWVERLPFGEDPARIGARPTEIGAVLVEPVLGREGVVLPPPGWLPHLASWASAHGALLVVDEIFTGFGRTGSWFAVDHERVRPDVLVVGKALGGGLPIAAAIASRSIFAAWNRGGEALHTATFLAHPLACSAALATLAVLEREGIPERAARLGAEVAARAPVWRDLNGVRAVRGRGLLWGIETTSAEGAARAQAALRRGGVLVLRAGARGEVIQFAPPLTISAPQLDFALAAIEAALREATRQP